MTEDEAFVRAVVDSPGDDTPRLVYADWLDDRNDPRAAYLRAEAEWAKPWRDGRRPEESRELRELAAGLDPVWVARVSRPPVGVCCDRVRFVECGPRLRTDTIYTAEEMLGCAFPTAYRAFLLNYNAGKVEPHELPDYVEGVYPLCEVAASFYAIDGTFDPQRGTGAADLIEMTEYLRSEEMSRFGPPGFPIDRFIPLANPMWHFDIVFLGVGREEFGKVYHLTNFQDYGLDRGNLTEVAASFPEFLTQLKPKWGE
jgi:uncharacterized protein (TIGR02996 family)